MTDPVLAAGAAPGASTGVRWFYGWVLLAVLWFILVANLAFPMYGGAVLNTALSHDLHFSREQLGLPFSVFFGVVGLSSPVVAAIIGRIGVRWTLLLGNLCTAAGSVCMATIVHSNLGAIVFFGGMVGFGVASGGNLTAQTAIPRWFVRRRSLAYAIMLTASAMGGIIAAPSLSAFLAATGNNWRGGWWVVAAIATAAGLLSVIFVREYPADIGQFPDGGTSGADIAEAHATKTPTPGILRQALLSADFWAISLASGVATGSISMILAHGIANALDSGYSNAQAVLSVGLVSSSGVAGKVIAGAIGDRFNPAYVWAALMVPMAAGLLLAALGTTSDIGLYAYAILVGTGFGAAIVCQPATIADRFGTANFARIAGVAYMLQAIAGIAVPALAGWGYSAAAGYRWSFMGVGVVCLISAVLLVMTCRKSLLAARVPA